MVTDDLIRFVAGTRYDDLPGDVIEMSRNFILDSVGASFGGLGTPIGKIALSVARTLGGHPQATIIGTTDRTSCTLAAYVNAKAANGLDFDDAHLNWLHIGPTLVPAALAVAQAERRPGKDLILAVAIGYDIASRLGLAMGMPFTLDQNNGVVVPQVVGTGWKVFGAALAGAVLLRLPPEQVRQTIAIAGANAPIPSTRKWELHADRPLPLQKTVDVGWMSQAGVMAAYLAREGATGFHDILEGDDGFWRMNGSPRFDEGEVLRDLGSKWHILEAGMKPYPSCRHLHVASDCFREIVEREDLHPGEIQQVRIGLSPMSTRPTWTNPQPRNLVEAQFSLPHSIAMLAFRIPCGPAWQTDDKLAGKPYREFRERVAMHVNPDTRDAMLSQYPGFYRELPAEVEVVSTRGSFVRSAKVARGDAWDPGVAMSRSDFVEKFRNNAQPVAGSRAARESALEVLLSELGALETLPDMADLHASLAAVAD